MTIKKQIDAILVAEANDEIVKSAATLLKAINAAQHARDVWIKRRQTEKKDLAALATRVYAAAEARDLKELGQLFQDINQVAGTSGLEEYRRKYGRVISYTDSEEEYGR